MHTSNHPADKRADATDRMKRAKPNRMQKVQVLPPHHVDLTLPQTPMDDIHVPAHVTGGDLSKGGPDLAASKGGKRST
ncbi:hypothetical protein AM571_CH03477 [Rhizobium etli 8C-3]|uniref:Uncharacterized protein n=2 Tax=Rhizobium TaxID=379 RepID=A0A4R3RK70_9HYPH|nr:MULTISPECIES: hypothetical protein [Rhizobium]APO76268.1 hypothetical protein AM571_CH03477 [Rhizobium etli 8C-3]TCU22337.1 hypothetical protein EV130_109129 [Rhizobium azibense]TCU35611.1 hypothetical protein EV129_109206 [Rhizobium azibense]